MRTLKGAINKATKKAASIGKDVYIGLNLGGFYYIFVGSCPSAYASVAKVDPHGNVTTF